MVELLVLVNPQLTKYKQNKSQLEGSKKPEDVLLTFFQSAVAILDVHK